MNTAAAIKTAPASVVKLSAKGIKIAGLARGAYKSEGFLRLDINELFETKKL